MNKLWLPAFVLMLFPLYFLIVRDNSSTQPDPVQNTSSYIEGIRIVQKKNGRNAWVATAKRADIIGKGDKADLTGIEVTVEEKGLTISAEKGLYELNGKKLTVTGPVTARDKDFTIKSRDVEFDNSTGSLKTDREVRVEGKKFTLTGTGLLADNNEQKIRILKNVHATYYN